MTALNLSTRKRIAARILKIGSRRIWLDPSKTSDIKEAITKADIKGLIAEGIIRAKPKQGVSRFRARVRLRQKRKGRRKGRGSRKGSQRARLPRKREWINKVRIQRAFVNSLKKAGLITPITARGLRDKIKGGFFRSKSHVKMFITENNLIKRK